MAAKKDGKDNRAQNSEDNPQAPEAQEVKEDAWKSFGDIQFGLAWQL